MIVTLHYVSRDTNLETLNALGASTTTTSTTSKIHEDYREFVAAGIWDAGGNESCAIY